MNKYIVTKSLDWFILSTNQFVHLVRWIFYEKVNFICELNVRRHYVYVNVKHKKNLGKLHFLHFKWTSFILLFFFFRLVLLYPCQIIRSVQYVRKMYFFSNVCTLYWSVSIAYMCSFVYIHYLCMFYRITCPKKFFCRNMYILWINESMYACMYTWKLTYI